MRKIIVIILCVMLLCITPTVAFAEGNSTDAVGQSTTEVGNSSTENEIATEGEISAPEKTVTENIVDYVKANIDKVVVIVVMTAYSIIESRIRGKMNGSIGTLNNNAIAIAKNSKEAIEAALSKVEGIANVVQNYQEAFNLLLEEIRNSEDEKKALKDALVKVESYLNTAKLANIEFANELAELLCLANIPNSKKDELYKKHVEGVHKLEAEEVKSNDGTQA